MLYGSEWCQGFIVEKRSVSRGLSLEGRPTQRKLIGRNCVSQGDLYGVTCFTGRGLHEELEIYHSQTIERSRRKISEEGELFETYLPLCRDWLKVQETQEIFCKREKVAVYRKSA